MGVPGFSKRPEELRERGSLPLILFCRDGFENRFTLKLNSGLELFHSPYLGDYFADAEL